MKITRDMANMHSRETMNAILAPRGARPLRLTPKSSSTTAAGPIMRALRDQVTVVHLTHAAEARRICASAEPIKGRTDFFDETVPGLALRVTEQIDTCFVIEPYVGGHVLGHLLDFDIKPFKSLAD